jgi:3-oxoacyl-[acyl-carrier protein] reductase
MRFAGKVVIVTGGGSGVGRACALRFASEGASVALADANGEAAESVAAEITALGHTALAATVNVADSAAVDSCVDSIVERLGPVSILVNSAGISHTNLVHLTTDDAWARMLAVNLSGSFYFARAAQRSMVTQRSGKIVNVSSQAALGTERGFVAYSSAKAGVQGLTRALSLDLGPLGINVNAVAPGHVESPLTHNLADEYGISYESIRDEQVQKNAIKRVAQPEDIAGVITFLASDDAIHVTGQVIYVTGRPNP